MLESVYLIELLATKQKLCQKEICNAQEGFHPLSMMLGQDERDLCYTMVPNIFWHQDQFHGRQFFHDRRWGRWHNKCNVLESPWNHLPHFTSHLMPPLIWQRVPGCSLDVGDPCWRVRAPLWAIRPVLGSGQVIHIPLLPTPSLVLGLPCSSVLVHHRRLSY